MNEFLRTSAGFERRTPGPDGALSGTASATRGGTQLQWSWALRPLI